MINDTYHHSSRNLNLTQDVLDFWYENFEVIYKNFCAEYEDLWGEGSVPYSEEVVDAYVRRYATPSRLGHQPTNEDFARIHHGGPNGWNSPSTWKYWSQVSSAMMSTTAGIA